MCGCYTHEQGGFVMCGTCREGWDRAERLRGRADRSYEYRRPREINTRPACPFGRILPDDGECHCYYCEDARLSRAVARDRERALSHVQGCRCEHCRRRAKQARGHSPFCQCYVCEPGCHRSDR